LQGSTFVKICGITRLGDARAAVRAGANAVGFVFAPSPRRIVPSKAKAIAGHLHPSVTSIGVFVDAAVEEVLRIAREVGLGGVQLQGAEPPETIEALRRAHPGLFISKVVRMLDAGSLAATAASPADAVMVDPKDPTDPGARSAPIPVEWLSGAHHEHLIVAGGLTPSSVGAVVRTLHPWGVDVSAGVEESPGRKDVALVRDFVAEVRAAERR
jgi:phosphoribosylanthranilate isomerase